MSFLELDSDELRAHVLSKSFYYVDITPENELKESFQLELVTLDKFDYDKIVEVINHSAKLISYDKPLILEMLGEVNKNPQMTGLCHQDHIGFYSNGKPLLRIKIKNPEQKQESDEETDPELENDEIIKKQPEQILHLSLQKYRSQKTEIIQDKKLNRIAAGGIGGLLLLGGAVVGMTFFKNSQ